MFFSQVSAVALPEILTALEGRGFAYNQEHEQLVIWGSPDLDIEKAVQMAAMRHG